MDELGLSKPIVKVWLALTVPNAQLRTWLPTAPEIAHVPGPVYAGVIVQFTFVPDGKTSVKVAPVTGPAALSVTVIVKPIGLPGATGVATGASVTVRFSTVAGGEATTTSLNCFVRAVMPASTGFVGL